MQNSQRLWRSLLFMTLFAALCGSAAFPFVNTSANAAPVMQAATDIVISEFRFHGSGGGNDEFIEIFNPTLNAVNISGWKINGSNSTGSTSTRTTIPTFTLQPGQHYLVAKSAGYTGSIIADLAYTAASIADDGGVALLRADNSIVDQIGLSSGSAYKEGTVLPSLTTDIDQSYERHLDTSGSCMDSNDNLLDFFRRDPSDPQNSSSPITTCGIPTSTPTSTNTATATPTIVPPRSIIINEVAWAGTGSTTTSNPTDEWFELYNNTGVDINLAGWRLTADDGSPDIALSGIIAAADPYYVFARSSSVFNDLIPDKTYPSGSLENGGETLYLLDANGNQVDSANIGGGAWDAGSGSPTFATMERQGTLADSATAWATYGGSTPVAHDRNGNPIKGTPGQSNWALTITATPTATATGTVTNTSLPTGFHSVIINEIAWSGTKANEDDEWIELYNTTNNPIDLNGWVLRSDDNSPIISLTGYSIAAKSYFLLARKTGAFQDVTPNLVYGETGVSSAYTLVNGGEVLRLKNSAGTDIDVANSYTGYGFTKWAAGSGTPNYASMERASYFVSNTAEWFTFASTPFAHDRSGNLINGTPGRANWAISITATPSKTPTTVRNATPIRTSTPLPAPPPPLLVINEFVPRPGHDWNNDGIVNVKDEYIEILNHGTIDVNLSGYSLDDEVNIGSDPYRLPSVTLKPGERIVFYGSETGLLLGDGGDGVRLLKPNGQLMDAYNYVGAEYPDQAFCRLPDNGGADDWNQHCFPTPGLQNSLSGGANPPSGDSVDEALCPIADTLPSDFIFAECPGFGYGIWSSEFWDKSGWLDEQIIPDIDSKKPVFAD